jgi:Outer membrane protein beta-barrel domain
MRRLAACFLLATASIAEAQDTGYVGLSFGSFDYEEEFVDPLLGQVSDSIDHYKVFGGFDINQHFAIEVNYSKAGDIEDEAFANIPPYGDIFYQLDMEITMTSVKALGMLPKDWGALIGGLGYFSSELDVREFISLECCGAQPADGTINDDGMMAVVGIEWRFGRFGARYGIRLEYEWWDMDGTDASAIGLGAFYGF